MFRPDEQRYRVAGRIERLNVGTTTAAQAYITCTLTVRSDPDDPDA